MGRHIHGRARELPQDRCGYMLTADYLATRIPDRFKRQADDSPNGWWFDTPVMWGTLKDFGIYANPDENVIRCQICADDFVHIKMDSPIEDQRLFLLKCDPEKHREFYDKLETKGDA